MGALEVGELDDGAPSVLGAAGGGLGDLEGDLLAGVLRNELICARRARVARLSPADLLKAGESLYVGNSLRGLIRAELLV